MADTPEAPKFCLVTFPGSPDPKQVTYSFQWSIVTVKYSYLKNILSQKTDQVHTEPDLKTSQELSNKDVSELTSEPCFCCFIWHEPIALLLLNYSQQKLSRGLWWVQISFENLTVLYSGISVIDKLLTSLSDHTTSRYTTSVLRIA